MASASHGIALERFKVLTFDCYGTLIDWETGIGSFLEVWSQRHGIAAGRDELLRAFAAAESELERRHPTVLYRRLLASVQGEIARRFDIDQDPAEGEAFAASIADWPPFADSVAALSTLKQSYKLAIISNVDRASFAHSNRHLQVEFDAVVTAEEVGAYKPDPRMFQHAFEILRKLGLERHEILHVAQSLYHDHVPAKTLGLSTVWVNRRRGQAGSGATLPPPGDVEPDLEVASLAELVALVDAAGTMI